jgi:N-methylhydantoinase B
LCGGYPGAVNDYVWVHAPQQAHNIDRFAQGLGDIPGDVEPISWGVFPLMGDDALYVHWNGGGGIGDPLDRPPERVAADLAAGLISKAAASEIYGTVQTAGSIDQKATTAKREELRQARPVAGPRQ